MLDQAFQALADPTRRAVVERLCDGPASVSELAKPFAMTLAAVVQHVQVLEAAGLVQSRKVGRVRTVQVDSAGLRSAEAEVLDALPDNEIKAAMESLPDGFRAAVYYTEVEGYTYAETAAILGVPHGTVMSRASRGRQRLRIALAHVA